MTSLPQGVYTDSLTYEQVTSECVVWIPEEVCVVSGCALVSHLSSMLVCNMQGVASHTPGVAQYIPRLAQLPTTVACCRVMVIENNY